MIERESEKEKVGEREGDNEMKGEIYIVSKINDQFSY